jgi:predicted transcriptional regulator YdeE
MVQDKKEIKGGTYAEINLQRCKEVQSISIGKTILDIDLFQIKDYVKKQSQLEKYVKLYNLVPMGENKGLWYYLSNDSICGRDCEKNEYAQNEIPKGKYAVVVIDDPFIFSLIRVWNYICKWILDKNEKINGLTLSNSENTACFVRFFMENLKEFMAVYVPIK